MEAIPRVLSPEEAKQWGLPEMIPIFPTEEVLAIEAMWSKYDLQQMARDYFLSPVGGKDLLIEKLIYIGALDKDGVATGMPMEPAAVPYVIGDPKKFCCRRCDACAPEELLKEGRFFDRMAWLRRHYQEEHPGVWGKGYAPSVKRNRDVERDNEIWYLGEWWEREYSSADAVVYRSRDGKKRLYVYWDERPKEVKPAPKGIPPLRIEKATQFLQIEGKRHKLVGVEMSELTAEIWAQNMRRHAEKIIIVPVQDGYAVYREE